MTRLINADEIKYQMLFKEDFLKGTGTEEQAVWKKEIDRMPTVDAIPVELIQKRIEYLRELANYDFDTNGGYVEHTHMRLYELEELLKMWEERKE